MTTSFVVHHVERISFLSVFFSFAFSSCYWCWCVFFSLSLPSRHIIKLERPPNINL